MKTVLLFLSKILYSNTYKELKSKLQAIKEMKSLPEKDKEDFGLCSCFRETAYWFIPTAYGFIKEFEEYKKVALNQFKAKSWNSNQYSWEHNDPNRWLFVDFIEQSLEKRLANFHKKEYRKGIIL